MWIQATSYEQAAPHDKITHALNKWAAGKPTPACNAVSDFVSLVATQTGKTIDPADAERWLADAAQAATLMGC